MLWKLILLFTVVPVIELYILMKLSGIIGAEYTILIIIVTGVLGGILAKSQGLGTLKKIRTEIQSGNLPTDQLLDGVLILSGGLLLMTPGIITDLTGFSLLIPFTRKPIKKFIIKYFKKKFENYQITIDNE